MNSTSFPIRPPTVAVFLGIAVIVGAAQTAPDQAKKEVNLTGDWILTFTSPNGDKREAPLKLKQDGETLTGVLSIFNGGQSPIEEGRISNEDVSFVVTRMRNGQKFVSKYSGKLSGDSIKGKIDGNFNGQQRILDFEAAREKEPEGATGNWRWSFTKEDGEKAEFTLRLKDENGVVTGVSVSASGNELPVSDGVSKNDEVSFRVVRERDDQKFTTQFHGKRDGDTIKGKIVTDWTGVPQSYDWEARRIRRRR